MKKGKLIVLLGLLLIGCGTTGNGPTTPNPVEITKTLKEVMSSFQNLKNYTYTINDEIFDIVTTLRYTENAYYYEPSKVQHGGESHGYAENEKGVFKYYINNGEVVFDNYLTDKKGEYVKNMWYTTILSFMDLNVNSLPNQPVEGNKYLIEDQYNKLLISGLAGFGDSALQSYIDVYIELTSNETFRTVIHTARLVGDYIGYAYGEISNVGTTKIDEIQQVLDNGGGPSDIDQTFIDMLKRLKEAKNYTLTLSGAVNYIDAFTVRNYYSKNLDNENESKGYAGSEYGVFSYKIVDNQVIAGEVISNGTNGVFDSIWSMTNFNSLANLNLANLNFEKNDDGSYTVKDYSTINNFSLFSHMGYANEQSDSLILKIFTDSIEFTFKRNQEVVNGKVDNLGSTSIPEIESYIANGNGPLIYDDLDDNGRTFLANLKKARNYTLSIESTYTSNSFELTKKYTSTSYYQDYSNDKNDFGYKEEMDGIYKIVNNDGTLTKGEKVKEEGAFLWASDLFKSFSDLDTSSISGKKLSPTTYRITDSNTKNLLCQIAGFDIYELMFYLDTVTLTILDSNTLSCKFEINLTGNYGKVIITLSDYGTTII